MIARRCGFGVERQRQIADVIHSSVDLGKNGILVVGVCRSSGVVPVHTIVAAVYIAGGGGDIRVVVVGAGGIVDAGPAVGECIGVGDTAVGRIVLKVVLVGQAADSRAGGAHLGRTPGAGVAVKANARHKDIILSVGLKHGDVVRGAGDQNLVDCFARGVNTYYPRGSIGSVSPTEIKIIGGYISNRETRGSWTGDDWTLKSIETVGVEPSAAGIGGGAAVGERHRVVSRGTDNPAVGVINTHTALVCHGRCCSRQSCGIGKNNLHIAVGVEMNLPFVEFAAGCSVIGPHAVLHNQQGVAVGVFRVEGLDIVRTRVAVAVATEGVNLRAVGVAVA